MICLFAALTSAAFSSFSSTNSYPDCIHFSMWPWTHHKVGGQTVWQNQSVICVCLCLHFVPVLSVNVRDASVFTYRLIRPLQALICSSRWKNLCESHSDPLWLLLDMLTHTHSTIHFIKFVINELSSKVAKEKLLISSDSSDWLKPVTPIFPWSDINQKWLMKIQ